MSSLYKAPILGDYPLAEIDQAQRAALEQLKSRLTAKSINTVRQTERILEELSILRIGTSFDQFTYWYYLTFCTGFGYVVRSGDIMQTRRGWLRPLQVIQHLGAGREEPFYLAVKPASPTTLWAVIDIDSSSRYHPASANGEGIEPVLEAVAGIGLIKAIEIQSSFSGGIHLLFPLIFPCRTWDLADALEQCIRDTGLEIRDGVLELRPNRKAYDSTYKAIRAPLTGEGNAIWIPDYGLVDELCILKKCWDNASVHNVFLLPEKEASPVRSYSSNRRGHEHKVRTLDEALARLKVGFTGQGQTQEIKLAALQTARLIEGVDSVDALRIRAHSLIEEAPGFSTYCGHQDEVAKRRLITTKELKRALELVPGGYKGTWKEKANLDRSSDARARAYQLMTLFYSKKFLFNDKTSAIQYLKAHGGPSRSWWMKQSNRQLLNELESKLVRPM